MVVKQGGSEVGPAYLDLGELASHLRISAQTVRRMVAAGDLPQPERFGRCMRWSRDVIGTFLADRRARSGGRADR